MSFGDNNSAAVVIAETIPISDSDTREQIKTFFHILQHSKYQALR